MSKVEKKEPVTVVISRRVRKGGEARFEELSGLMTEAASKFPGHLGAAMFRPGNPEDPEYRVVFKFDSQANLDRWLNSDVRQHWLNDIERLLQSPSAVETLSGLVTWFTLPGCNPVRPPPKYKMMLVSWLALFPTVTLIFWLFGELLAEVPLIPRTALVSAVVMALMAYVLMPRFTRWFSFWLFPRDSRETR